MGKDKFIKNLDKSYSEDKNSKGKEPSDCDVSKLSDLEDYISSYKNERLSAKRSNSVSSVDNKSDLGISKLNESNKNKLKEIKNGRRVFKGKL